MRLQVLCLLSLMLSVCSLRQEDAKEEILGVTRSNIPSAPIKVAQYNMLASYLGNNDEAWFLYPLELKQEVRAQIMEAVSDFWKQQAAAKQLYTWHNDGKDENASPTWIARASSASWTIEGFQNNGMVTNYMGLLSDDEAKEVRRWNEHFAWSNRGPKVMNLLRSLDADLLSVVELDVKDEMHEALGKDVYDMEWRKRPRANSKDGCGIFWKKERFEQVELKPLEFSFRDFKPDTLPLKLNDDTGTQDRIMLGVPLRELATGHVILAVSTHLMKQPADGKMEKIRIEEVVQMMNMINHYASLSQAVGIVIMGDFNAATNSFLHILLEKTWVDCSGRNKSMKDAHRTIRTAASCTTRTTSRSDVIDYIYYSESSLELQKEGTNAELCPTGPIPDETNPSDHTPIFATFVIREDTAPMERCEIQPSALLELNAFAGSE